MKRAGAGSCPRRPTCSGCCARQVAVTIEGVDAFAAWAGGRRGRGARRCATPSTAATSPSASCWARCARPSSPRSSPRTCSRSRAASTGSSTTRATLISESEVMACPPDAGIAEMAALLGEAVRHIDAGDRAVSAPDRGEATEAADAAIRTERRARAAPTTRAWRRCSRSRTCASASPAASSTAAARGSATRDWIAERVVYAVVKQS